MCDPTGVPNLSAEPVAVAVKALHEDAHLPTRGTPLASGWDLRSVARVELAPGARALVPTGLSVALPPGYEMQIRPRSGLAWRHGVTVLNAPGTVDADYRGEVKVLMIHLGTEHFTIEPGDRIAQAIVAQHAEVTYAFVEALPTTERGTGGFGHTGHR